MAHSKVKIWVHAIWGTKHRDAFITHDAEPKVHELIRKELIESGCYVEVVNGMSDHVHALFLLNPDLSIRAVMKQVKGAASHAINQLKIIPHQFAWGVGFAAFSVGESQVPTIRNYILNQKEHHQKRSFQQEYRALIH
ncbi:MAG: IS200/IS605 family transposase [Saprospiraceae bacterium]|nr:IS200/IS605 family transposase [Saprospiraceae bacterium]